MHACSQSPPTLARMHPPRSLAPTLARPHARSPARSLARTLRSPARFALARTSHMPWKIWHSPVGKLCRHTVAAEAPPYHEYQPPQPDHTDDEPAVAVLPRLRVEPSSRCYSSRRYGRRCSATQAPASVHRGTPVCVYLRVAAASTSTTRKRTRRTSIRAPSRPRPCAARCRRSPSAPTTSPRPMRAPPSRRRARVVMAAS